MALPEAVEPPLLGFPGLPGFLVPVGPADDPEIVVKVSIVLVR